MTIRLTESQQAAEASLRMLLTELGGMSAADAEAHVIQAGAFDLLTELPAAFAAIYASEIASRAPGIADDLPPLGSSHAGHVRAGLLSPPNFPTETLPWQVARYVMAAARSIGVDDSMVGLPVLACLAGVIGNRRRVRLKADWVEPAIIWGAVVSPSGTRKTPALSEVTRPLRHAEAEAIQDEQARRSEYEAELQRWKEAGRSKRGERPTEPPPRARLLVSDVTVEALALRLSHSPAGVLLYRDELAGWIRSFGQYKGRQSGDTQAWLEMHRAAPIIVDRRGSDTLSVRRAAVSVIGTVQPEVLAAVLSGEHMSDGLAARLLFVIPPVRAARWTDDEIGDELRREWGALLGELAGMPYDDEPVDLPLSPRALARYRRFHDEQSERAVDADTDPLSAAASKIVGYAARLALIVTLAADPGASVVDDQAMSTGIDLASWFAGAAESVYERLRERPEDAQRRRLVDWIRTQGGRVTARRVAHGPRVYRGNPGLATMALDELVELGIGRWETREPGPKGGRPTRDFVLETGTGTKTVEARAIDAANIGEQGTETSSPDAVSHLNDRPQGESFGTGTSGKVKKLNKTEPDDWESI